MNSIDLALCGERCYIAIEFYVTKLGIDLGLGKSIPWLFSFWPWKPCRIVIPVAKTGYSYRASLGDTQTYTYGVEEEVHMDANEISCLVEAYPSKEFATYMVNSVSYILNSVLRSMEQAIRIVLPLAIAVLILDTAIMIRNLVRVR